jgi:GT2 family glycosyltransferase
LIPFQLTDLIIATNPVKVYEYLSAGKPALATALPELEQLSDLVYLASDADEFSRSLEARVERSSRPWLRSTSARLGFGAGLDVTSPTVREGSDRPPLVSVILLTYNNLDYTKACLQSLDRWTDYRPWELVVVDNASTDGTPEFLKQYATGRAHVRLVLNTTNLGFAAANNCGIRVARGDFIILLNKDTYLTPGWLFGRVRHLSHDPTRGLVSPITNAIGNEAKIEVEYSSMEEMRLKAADYTKAHSGQLMMTSTVAFFCVAFRRKLIDEVGVLDEGFSVGFFEDDDYCRRVRDRGSKVAIAEDVFIHHHLSATFGAVDVAERSALFEQNREYYESKWGPWTPHVYRRDTETPA